MYSARHPARAQGERGWGRGGGRVRVRRRQLRPRAAIAPETLDDTRRTRGDRAARLGVDAGERFAHLSCDTRARPRGRARRRRRADADVCEPRAGSRRRDAFDAPVRVPRRPPGGRWRKGRTAATMAAAHVVLGAVGRVRRARGDNDDVSPTGSRTRARRRSMSAARAIDGGVAHAHTRRLSPSPAAAAVRWSRRGRRRRKARARFQDSLLRGDDLIGGSLATVSAGRAHLREVAHGGDGGACLRGFRRRLSGDARGERARRRGSGGRRLFARSAGVALSHPKRRRTAAAPRGAGNRSPGARGGSGTHRCSSVMLMARAETRTRARGSPEGRPRRALDRAARARQQPAASG